MIIGGGYEYLFWLMDIEDWIKVKDIGKSYGYINIVGSDEDVDDRTRFFLLCISVS